jgi:hypothetical protein
MVREPVTMPCYWQVVQLGRFAWSNHPAHHIAAEDNEDNIEMEVGLFDWTQRLGHIPTSDVFV